MHFLSCFQLGLQIKSKYNTAGIKLVISAFGLTKMPTTAGTDAASTANKMATWVKQYGLDSIDVNYEDLAAMNAGDGKAEAWLEMFTKTLHSQLLQGQYILTYAHKWICNSELKELY